MLQRDFIPYPHLVPLGYWLRYNSLGQPRPKCRRGSHLLIRPSERTNRHSHPTGAVVWSEKFCYRTLRPIAVVLNFYRV